MKKKIFIFLGVFTAIIGCSLNENSVQPEDNGASLRIITRRTLQVPEPSGLTFFGSDSYLWTVSDQTGILYKIDRSGRILKTLDINGSDLEGVCYNDVTNELLVVEENLAEVVRLDTLGNIKGRSRILDTHDNSGLEGVCVDKIGTIFVLKEKDPGLFIELNTNLSVRESVTLTFASDYSDITCDITANRFWIASDQDQKIFLWDKAEGVLEEYSIPVENPEGIAVDFQNERFYLTSDSRGELYVLSK